MCALYGLLDVVTFYLLLQCSLTELFARFYFGKQEQDSEVFV